jgi:hypothetical protein
MTPTVNAPHNTAFNKLKDLFCQMDYIEGTTEGGRQFTMKHGNDDVFKTQIINSDGDAYEPIVRYGDIIGKNILSTINKMESKFFNGRAYMNKTQRKKIKVIGTKEKEKFIAELKIDNNYSNGNLYFRGNFNPLTIRNKIPEHIHTSQRHDWLYLYYKKQENWTDILEFDFKNFYYKCCGEEIRGRYNYCHTCGKEQEVLGIVIESVVGKELLTKLA